MRRVRQLICCCATIAAIWCCDRSSARAAGPALPDPIPTRQTLFSIPFTLPPNTDPALEPVEVRLYASSDAGATWPLAARVDTKQKSFTFKAPHDGEYWFVIRTVDRQGRVRPENARGPELRVVVDTLPPRLDLNAARLPNGEVGIHWASIDPLLSAETLRLEYQVTGDALWHSIAVEFPPPDPNRTTFDGDARFRPEVAGAITVRGQISDKAGNTGATQSAVADNPQPSGDRPGMVSNLRPPSSTSWPADTTTPQTVRATNGFHTAPDMGTMPARDPWAAGGASTDSSNSTAGSSNGPALTGPALTGPGFSPANSSPATGTTTLVSSSGSTAPTTGAVESHINPAVESRIGVANSGGRIPGLPPGERPYMVNSRKFALEYEVAAAGTAGVAKIEIWGTRDGGRVWQSYGVEPSARGPLKVSVAGEGLYGFRITVQDRNGLGGQPPKPGDLPELWVGVDLTKPAVRWSGFDLGTGPHAGELQIRWEASDAMLAARPITLLFSDRPGGPWSTVAAGLDNTGSFTWRFDGRVPDRVYLRLEARDEAGNIGVAETPDPVSLNAGRPEGHIREVRPLTDDGARVQTYQFYR